MAQIVGVLGHKALQLCRIGGVGFFANAEFFGQALGQNAHQRIGKIEGVHAHVEQAGDGLCSRVGVQG